MITIKPIALLGHLCCSCLQLYEEFSIINSRWASNLMVLLNTMSKLLKRARLTLEGICACSSRHGWLLSPKTTWFSPYSSLLALKLNFCSLLRNGVKEQRRSICCKGFKPLELYSSDSSACIFQHCSLSEVLTNWWAHFKRIREGKLIHIIFVLKFVTKIFCYCDFS